MPVDNDDESARRERALGTSDADVESLRAVYIKDLEALLPKVTHLLENVQSSYEKLSASDKEYVTKDIIETAYKDFYQQLTQLIERLKNGEEIEFPYADHIKRDEDARGGINDPRRSYGFYLDHVGEELDFKLYLNLNSKTWENVSVDTQWRAGGEKQLKYALNISGENYIPALCGVRKKKEPEVEKPPAPVANTTFNKILRQLRGLRAEARTYLQRPFGRTPKQNAVAPQEEDIPAEQGLSESVAEAPAPKSRETNYRNILANKYKDLGYFQNLIVVEKNNKTYQYSDNAWGNLSDAINLKVFEADYVAKSPNLAFELDRTLVNFGGLPITKCKLDVILQLLEILKILEQEGLSHNDIKPDNILITYKNGRAILSLIDFDPKNVRTFSSNILGHFGTPRFWAPEIFASLMELAVYHQGKVDGIEIFRKSAIRASLGLPKDSDETPRNIERYWGLEMLESKFGKLFDIGKTPYSIKKFRDYVQDSRISKWLNHATFIENDIVDKREYKNCADIYASGITITEIMGISDRVSLSSTAVKTFLKTLNSTPIGKMLAFSPRDRGTAKELYEQTGRYVSSLLGKQVNPAMLDTHGALLDSLFGRTVPVVADVKAAPLQSLIFRLERDKLKSSTPVETPHSLFTQIEANTLEEELQNIINFVKRDFADIAGNAHVVALLQQIEGLKAVRKESILEEFWSLPDVNLVSLRGYSESSSMDPERPYSRSVLGSSSGRLPSQSRLASQSTGSPVRQSFKMPVEELYATRVNRLAISLLERTLQRFAPDTTSLRSKEILNTECIDYWEKALGTQKEIATSTVAGSPRKFPKGPGTKPI